MQMSGIQWPHLFSYFYSPKLIVVGLLLLLLVNYGGCDGSKSKTLRFNAENGRFKILQVADMHYANGNSTTCLNVFPYQARHCSDLNTTAFLRRMIRAENPDLIVFTGDNIFGLEVTDPVKSMNAAFEPAIESNIPWAAILGNHDQESTLSRRNVMKHIVTMPNTLSQFNPLDIDSIDGYGNYNLEVAGPLGSEFQNKSRHNIFFLDSGDYSTVPSIPGYGWIKASQQYWFLRTSKKLKTEFNTSNKQHQKQFAPALVFFHIPLPEYAKFHSSKLTGWKQEGVHSAILNSGFFTTMVEAGHVKAVFVGHDHLNDFCGELRGINLCYAGGFGYHAYGKAGRARRARVVEIDLEKTKKGAWGTVKSIKTWKRLDDENLTAVHSQALWSERSAAHGSRVSHSNAFRGHIYAACSGIVLSFLYMFRLD